MAYYVGMSAIIRKASCGRKNAAAERKQNMRYRRYSASSLTDSLRSVVRLRRAVPAYGRDGNFLVVDARRSLTGSDKVAAKPFFHRLRPLTSITKSDAQISGGETRQDLKIPGVSPWWLPRALSCSCLSVYRCHSAVMAARSFSRLTLSSG
jgi:hypothetical protein